MITINPGMTIPEWPHQRPSGKLYLATKQLDLVSGDWTLVELDAIPATFADGIEHAGTHRIIPGQAGFYDVKGQVRYTSVVADHSYYSGIWVNGTDLMAMGLASSSIAADLIVSCSAHLYLSATDYIELLAMHIAGVNTVDIAKAQYNTFLSLQRVR